MVRGSIEYSIWRLEVFKRDNFTCKECGKKGGWNSVLKTDHIKQFALILKENNIKSLDDARSCKELWDINNGRTLCKECHKKTPTWGINLCQQD